MAIYHCSVKTISRSEGRSAIGAVAYRAGICLIDERTGENHNYNRKRGVEYTEVVLPQGIPAIERGKLWNAAEAAEKRKNSTVAREYEIALPDELDRNQRQVLAVEFARHLANRYGVAADVAIHAPGRGGDFRNHHAHILTTTRQIDQGGALGAKTRSLDDRRSGEVEHIRSTWAHLVNKTLERAGHTTRVSHKSLEEQGIQQSPGIHLGPAATAMERRGLSSDRGRLHRELVADRRAVNEVELTATKRIEAGLERIKTKVNQYQAVRASAAQIVEQQEQERLKTAKEAEIKMKREQEKKTELLQKEKQEEEKAKSRNYRDPGIGR
jgi:ATP-dependent exoDNAse (exonuclease V) alpha subunit